MKNPVLRNILVCLGLVLTTVAVYWPVHRFPFLNYDDFYIFFGNTHVRAGLVWDSIVWGATTHFYEYWHPLMWWSHMLDCQLFGLNPGPQHLVNLGFHVANTWLVFAVFQRMTGKFWRSAMVAALFALHPLHVETVAWLAERKEVLSAFFWLLSVWAYARYAQARGDAPGERTTDGLRTTPPHEPGSSRRKEAQISNFGSQSLLTSAATAEGFNARNPSIGSSPPSRGSLQHPRDSEGQNGAARRFYWLSVGFFVLGLLTKPMVVTLPFVLLLLDYWPLGRIPDFRFRFSDWRNKGEKNSFVGMVREKLPFFALSALFCFTTWYSVSLSHEIHSSERIPWLLRLTNIPVAYASYLWKTIYPVNLAVLYPLPAHWPWWLVLATTLMLIAITGLVLSRARKAGYLVFGWLMFLGMLVPTIGIVPVGLQYMADRYMYLPSIGLFTALVWIVADLAASWPGRNAILGGAGGVILAVCAMLTWAQLAYWKDNLSLWKHCIALGYESPIAHYNLGGTYMDMGDLDNELDQYAAALRMDPTFSEANLNYGTALMLSGKPGESTNYFLKALEARPDYVDAMEDLGLALLNLGNYDGAMAQFSDAIRLAPGRPSAITDMGEVLSAEGKPDDAVSWFQAALKANPAFSEAHFQLGQELLKRGEFAKGIASLERSAQFDPDAVRPLMAIAAAYRGAQKPAEAIAEYRKVLTLNPNLREALNNLAWLLASYPDATYRNGPEAVQLAVHACALTSSNQTIYVGTLAAAYAEAGQFDQAVEAAQKACALATSHGETELLKKNQEFLALYEKHQPYHEGQ